MKAFVLGMILGAMVMMVVAVILAVVLVGLIVFPMVTGKMDEQAVKLDEQVESTAIRLAEEQNTQLGSGTRYVVYDLNKKCFVDAKDAADVEPYGNSNAHKDMVIYIKVVSRDEISAIWDLPVNRNSYY